MSFTVGLLFISFAVFLILNIPIAVALGLATGAAVLTSNMPLTLVVQRIFASNDNFPLMAIPFFMLAGSVMTKGGVSKRLVAFADALVGWLTGGLGIVATLAGMFFAAISGSSAATTAAIGPILFPEMEKRGYNREFAAAIVAAAGETGIIIPPSVTMVVYGVIAGVSIGDLFLGGFGPGILMGLSMAALIYFVAKRHNYGGTKWAGLANVGKTFAQSIWGLLMPIIILGGIYGGIFTPTEAAAVAVVYGLFVGFFIYKDLKLSDLPKIVEDSVKSTAVVMFIMDAAGLFSWIITSQQVPVMLANYFVSLTNNPTTILMLINILLLIVGCFLNASAAVTILAPILVPVVTQMGIDPVFFGVLMVVNLAIGTITPPVGVDLFVATTIAKIPLERISRAIVSFLVVLILDLIVITYVPGIVMWVPNMVK
ncbi:TRAP transporter large permease [Thermoanaerobacteraceae bacterium SP2]|nr:TRAP transporter large permease [Thermoanaerobacteraceae bacterium SP2]